MPLFYNNDIPACRGKKRDLSLATLRLWVHSGKYLLVTAGGLSVKAGCWRSLLLGTSGSVLPQTNIVSFKIYIIFSLHFWEVFFFFLVCVKMWCSDKYIDLDSVFSVKIQSLKLKSSFFKSNDKCQLFGETRRTTLETFACLFSPKYISHMRLKVLLFLLSNLLWYQPNIMFYKRLQFCHLLDKDIYKINSHTLKLGFEFNLNSVL